MKKYSKKDQKSLATWAADCALRVLPLFEKAHPQDPRPRQAIATCRTWVRTGVFQMSIIRHASLSSHAAARLAKATPPACFAARAAGQAVATAHVPQHAFGAACYALKAIIAAQPKNAPTKIAREHAWQSRRLPQHLRHEMQTKIIIHHHHNGEILIKILKDKHF